MSSPLGQKCWVLADGYIPATSHGPAPELTSHEALCILNTGAETAHVEVVIYFEDRAPVGPFHLEVAGERTRHFRFNEFRDPERIPTGTGYACTVRSDVPVVVQQTRLDSRQAENALMSTIAYPVAG